MLGKYLINQFVNLGGHKSQAHYILGCFGNGDGDAKKNVIYLDPHKT